MKWLDKVLAPLRRSAQLPTLETTRPQLEREKKRRQTERERTEKLARLINDYRAQDGVLRR